jgi:two-component system, response regulator YesN
MLPDGLQQQISEEAFNYFERLGRVRAFVERNLGKRIALHDVAAVACMNRSYFSSFFRRSVGVTFSEWLRFVRVEKAARLFQERDHTVQEVSAQVGFSSLRTFERWFLHHAGMSPRQYRHACRPRTKASQQQSA